jgi:hypothetical protein
VLQGGGDWAGCMQITGPKGEQVPLTVRSE